MPGPPITLLKKGSLVARMGENQANLDKLVPINYIMDWFDKRIDNKVALAGMSDRVVVLLSKTGSGKSTSIAPNLYLRFFKRYRKNIIITQPRQLTATEIPKDIAMIKDYQKPNKDGLSIELYRNLGYQTHEFVKKPIENGILFCTTGVLLQFLKHLPSDKFCKRFRFVIVDEAHDRSLDVDLILLLMKRLITANINNNAPFLILMSATLNVGRFCRYFNTKTVFEVTGQSKPIEVVYPPVDVYDIYGKACDIMRDIERYEQTHPPEGNVRDVIIFMPQMPYINQMVQALTKLNDRLQNKILPIGISGADVKNVTENMRLVLETDPSKLFVPGSNNKEVAFRRVIVSTNVAETGLTLDSLRYCIDTALHFTKEFNPRHGAAVMCTKPVTLNMSLQRKGRVGRKHPGVFFPLYTEKTADSLFKDNIPKVEVEDFTSHMLALIVSSSFASIDRLEIWEMLTPPSDDMVRYSLERLFVLGAIDINGQATELGKMMNTFHMLSMESVKMILSGLVFGASLKELVCLACLLSVRKTDIVLNQQVSGVPAYDTASLMYELDEADDKFAKCNMKGFNRLKTQLLIGCEMLDLLIIYEWFTEKVPTVSTVELIKWCERKGLNYHSLCKITEFIDESFWGMLSQLRINPVSLTSEDDDLYQVMKRSVNNLDQTELVESVIRLKQCIYEGYKCNTLIWNEDANSYQTEIGMNTLVKSPIAGRLRHQNQGLKFDQEKPQVLVCKEILIQADRRTGRFVHEAKVVSIMDGYVHTDLQLIHS